MRIQLDLPISPQPDEVTCGPTCLDAVYRYFGHDVPLERLVDEVEMLDRGGTLAVHLGCDALARGFAATLYTYNLRMFDPTWFGLDRAGLRQRLISAQQARDDPELATATSAYLRFLDLGGEIRFEELSGRLLRRFLDRDLPILTGLSATYLYGSMRERPGDNQEDDLLGEPVGHFVVLCGYDRVRRRFRIADPYQPNPLSSEGAYEVGSDRLLGAILLGTMTWDGNLLILEPTPNRGAGRACQR